MMRNHQRAIRPFCSTLPLLAAALSLGACNDSGTGPLPGVKVLWSVNAPGVGRPAADESTVYFGSSEHELIAVDRATGKIRWRNSSGSDATPFIAGGDVILAGDVAVIGDVALRAFDRATGQLRWAFSGLDTATFTDDMPGAFPMATDGVHIFAGSGRGRATALKAMDGSTSWRVQLSGDLGDAVRDPYVFGGTVYYVVLHAKTPYQGDLFALDAATGSVRWSRSYGGENGAIMWPLGPVAAIGSTIAFGTIDGSIHAVDAATGEDLWNVPAPAGESANGAPRWVVARDDEFIVFGEGQMIGLDPATGLERWSRTVSGGRVFGPISTESGDIYSLLDNYRKLGAYDMTTGNDLWIISPPGGAQRFGGLPLVASDTIFVTTTNALVALQK